MKSVQMDGHHVKKSQFVKNHILSYVLSKERSVHMSIYSRVFFLMKHTYNKNTIHLI